MFFIIDSMPRTLHCFCYTIYMKQFFSFHWSAFLFLGVCALLGACNEYAQTDVTFPDGFVVRARIADTPQKTEKGLMFVKNLPEDEAMLFVFDQENTQYFWMKNTLIDLDILFLNPEGKINELYERVPHTYTYTPDHQIPVVAGKAQYVLEAAAGTISRHGLKKGNLLHFERTNL